MITIEELTTGIQGWLTADEGKLLYGLASNVEDPIVEIGAWKGRSTIWLLAGAKQNNHVITIDHFKGSSEHKIMYGEDVDTFLEFIFNMAIAHRDLEIKSRLSIFNMDSAKAADLLLLEVIGMLFIDGAHEYEFVRDDFYNFYRNVVPDGYIAFHDCGYEGIKQVINEAKELPELIDWKQVGSIEYCRVK